jgi:type II secretory pathway predicted ATPase ExeA
MYLEHYGLAEAPFRITPHTDFFFSGANRGATLEALIYAITHDEGIVKVSGEVGSGKTMLCRVLMERLPENVVIVYLANPSLSRDDILYALADELGVTVPEHGRASAVMRTLQEKLVALYAEGKQVVVLIDEAHAMPQETLEEIRLLSNLESSRHKLLQLVLFGQPEINETLTRPDMRQLRERITHNFSLEPLLREDIAQYLDFRMRAAGYHGPGIFAPAAVKLIAEASQGLTRRINILADKALLSSFAAGTHQVGSREVRAAIRDSEFATVHARRPGQRTLPPAILWVGIGAFAMLALSGIWRLVSEPATTPAAAAGIPASQPLRLAPPVSPAPAIAEEKPVTPQTEAPPAAKPDSAQAEPTPVIAVPEKPESSTPPPLPEAKQQPTATASKKSANPPPSATPLLESQLAASRGWLGSVAADRWFVQLYTVDGNHPDHVEIFLAKLRSTGMAMDQVRVYHSKLSGTARYGVVFGDYASRQDAVNALDTLPAAIRPNHPYARQAVRLR